MSTTTLATSGLSAPASSLGSALITGFFIILIIASVPASWYFIRKTSFHDQATNLIALEIFIYSLVATATMVELYGVQGILEYVIPGCGAALATLAALRVCSHIEANTEGDEGKIHVDTDVVIKALKRDCLQTLLVTAIGVGGGVTMYLLAPHASPTWVMRDRLVLAVGVGVAVGLLPLMICLYLNSRLKRADEIAAENARREAEAKERHDAQLMDDASMKDQNEMLREAIDRGTHPLPQDLSVEERTELRKFPIGRQYMAGNYVPIPPSGDTAYRG